MAANQYVQAAAGQLQSAATAVKGDMDRMRAEFMTYERQANSEINSKEAEIHAINAKLSREQPPETQVTLQMLSKKLQNDIDGKKRELEERRSQVTQETCDKEGAVVDLMSQSKGLQNQAASLK